MKDLFNTRYDLVLEERASSLTKGIQGHIFENTHYHIYS